MYSKGHGGNIYDEAINYDFSVNTNPLGMPEDVKEKLKENLGDICEVYPEETCYELRNSISLKENISEHQIICGNGASELIYGLVRAIIPDYRVLFPYPVRVTFLLPFPSVLTFTLIKLDHPTTFVDPEPMIQTISCDKFPVIVILNPLL